MVITCQSLGRLDARLVDEQERFSCAPGLPSDFLTLFAETEAFQDHLLLSYLWVLGAYELVRAIDQQCAEKTNAVERQFAEDIRELKQLFTRVRVPLAKFEPAQAHHETDSRIAWPNFQSDSGVGWRVSHDIVISRRLLADRLIVALEHFPATNSVDPGGEANIRR